MAHPMTPKQEHAARGSSRWMHISRQIRRERPLCELCCPEGRGLAVSSEVVHHINEVKGDKVRLLHVKPDELMALCIDCHERIHGRARRPEIGPDGWPLGSM
jgi:hypothetical protein